MTAGRPTPSLDPDGACRDLLAACSPRTAPVATWLAGRCLRLLRTARNISQSHAGSTAGCSIAVIRAVETGTRTIRPAEMTALCDVYHPADDIKDGLQALISNFQPGWWDQFSTSVLSPPTRLYLALEDACTQTWQYQPTVIPGLLQTPNYAAAVLARTNLPPSVIAGRLQARLERQRRILAQRRRPRVDITIAESVLMRGIATPAEMREQIHLIADLANFETVRVRVLPSAARLHENRPATIFSIGPEGCAWRESGTSMEPANDRRYAVIRDATDTAALDAESSRKLILDAARHWNSRKDVTVRSSRNGATVGRRR
ncbi:helix-turn-helix domain-containing protein [Micromonospora sp. NBC_01813]|uniref:helix-turn-helix domain-containing protein n=1 Tax=Micromonospora sp. NBC_01813 TaxID=2975988 RepID=UPI002DDA43CA|nr:helix-turn-helix transcriptional regulator [Micromonospora sp. NBC_01813]WSA10112.1 helix-turn-helix transcriptional regulator [Micromonospora sp. NBC_01813]